jgi:nucleoporin POM152
MSGTPRLRSSYPSTPGSGQRNSGSRQSPQDDASRVRSPLPNLPQASPVAISSNTPLVPVDLVDGPTQRFYALTLYGGLLVWCLYEWWRLVEEDTQSIWLFIKWTGIFAMFLYGVPQLRIPWLEWSMSTSNVAFLLHSFLTGMLMFRMPVCPPLFVVGDFANCIDSFLSKAGCSFLPRQFSTGRCQYLRTVFGLLVFYTMLLL